MSRSSLFKVKGTQSSPWLLIQAQDQDCPFDSCAENKITIAGAKVKMWWTSALTFSWSSKIVCDLEEGMNRVCGKLSGRRVRKNFLSKCKKVICLSSGIDKITGMTVQSIGLIESSMKLWVVAGSVDGQLNKKQSCVDLLKEMWVWESSSQGKPIETSRRFIWSMKLRERSCSQGSAASCKEPWHHDQRKHFFECSAVLNLCIL